MSKKTPSKNAGGLYGKDRGQDSLRDCRQGAFDSAGTQVKTDVSQRKPRQGARRGADVPGDPVSAKFGTARLPEGLKRQRMGPYDQDCGRDTHQAQRTGPPKGRS
jgi:hypothetical protein